MTRKLTFPYSLIMAFYWANFAVLLNYASVYLLGRGLPNTSIGLLISAASLLAAAAQPLLGSYADRPESPSVKKLLLIGCLCFLLLTAVLMHAEPIHSYLLMNPGKGGSLNSFLLELTRRNNWIVTLCIGAIFELYSSFRMERESSKSEE